MLDRLAEAIGAHRVPHWNTLERKRAAERAAASLGLSLFWAVERIAGRPDAVPAWFLALTALYGLASVAYLRALRRMHQAETGTFYSFLVLDPLFLVGILLLDAERLAFLGPLVPAVIVGAGIRYGKQAMVLSWAVALIAAPALATSAVWSSNLGLSLGYLLMLVVVPMLFLSLVRRIDDVRLVEEERGRSAAIRDLAVARSAFLSKVSHELLSPLQGIVSALDVIEMRHARAFEGDQELIGRMRRSSMLLNTQLRDLLTLAKGEAGRLEINAEPFEACSLVEAMAEGARDTALAKGLRLVVEVPQGPLFVRADGARIDQVLTNLVANSIRFTDSGEVRISMHSEGRPVTALRFEVSDTGSGIPEALLPTLFMPDQVGNTTARRGQGSGIGLAIVRLLVDRMGGRLDVGSRVGEGTVFSLEIPVATVDTGAPA